MIQQENWKMVSNTLISNVVSNYVSCLHSVLRELIIYFYIVGIEIDGDVESAEGKKNIDLCFSLFYLISDANINISVIHCLEEEKINS